MTTLGITGASGHLAGSILTHLLAAQSVGDVVAITRSPEKVERAFGPRVHVRRGDFDDEGGLAAAFRGIDRLLLIPASDLTPGVRPRQHRAAIAAAVAAGIRHIIYVSSVGARPGPGDGLLETHFVTEQAVIESGLPWTLLRMNIYADSQVDALRRAMSSGEYSAQNDAPLAYVVRDELGAAAAAILGTPGHDGVTYHGTGPTSVTHAELAEAASRACGRPVRFVALSRDQDAARLTAAGLPAPLVDVLGRFQRAARDGAFDLVSGDIGRLTGRKATAATDFLVTALQRET